MPRHPEVGVAAGGDTGPDSLTYTIQFQVSDFFTLGNLVIRDLLSDGQSYVPGSAQINGAQILPQFVTVNSPPPCDLSPTPWGLLPQPFPPYPWLTPPLGNGPPHIGTVLGFDLSGAIGTSGVFLPSTTGTITFQTIVDDTFACPVAGDMYVDKFDREFDYLTISGDVLDNSNPDPSHPIGHAQDDSGTQVDIKHDSIEKCVYRIDRAQNATGDVLAEPGYCNPVDPLPSPLPQVAPGDRITFRILKTIPASDWENLTVTDFLPNPVLSYGGLDFVVPSDTCPGPSNAPDDPNTNSVTLLYGSSGLNNNMPCTIDALVTATVSTDPFPDHLVRDNQATECEDNSFAETTCQVAVAPFELGEPVLQINKGAIAACQPDPQGACPPGTAVGSFNPPVQGTFTPPGSPGARFTSPLPLTSQATINSSVTVERRCRHIRDDGQEPGLQPARGVRRHRQRHAPAAARPAAAERLQPQCQRRNAGAVHLRYPLQRQRFLRPWHQALGPLSDHTSRRRSRRSGPQRSNQRPRSGGYHLRPAGSK